MEKRRYIRDLNWKKVSVLSVPTIIAAGVAVFVYLGHNEQEASLPRTHESLAKRVRKEKEAYQSATLAISKDYQLFVKKKLTENEILVDRHIEKRAKEILNLERRQYLEKSEKQLTDRLSVEGE